LCCFSIFSNFSFSLFISSLWLWNRLWYSKSLVKISNSIRARLCLSATIACAFSDNGFPFASVLSNVNSRASNSSKSKLACSDNIRSRSVTCSFSFLSRSSSSLEACSSKCFSFSKTLDFWNCNRLSSSLCIFSSSIWIETFLSNWLATFCCCCCNICSFVFSLSSCNLCICSVRTLSNSLCCFSIFSNFSFSLFISSLWLWNRLWYSKSLVKISNSIRARLCLSATIACAFSDNGFPFASVLSNVNSRASNSSKSKLACSDNIRSRSVTCSFSFLSRSSSSLEACSSKCFSFSKTLDFWNCNRLSSSLCIFSSSICIETFLSNWLATFCCCCCNICNFVFSCSSCSFSNSSFSNDWTYCCSIASSLLFSRWRTSRSCISLRRCSIASCTSG